MLKLQDDNSLLTRFLLYMHALFQGRTENISRVFWFGLGFLRVYVFQTTMSLNIKEYLLGVERKRTFLLTATATG